MLTRVPETTRTPSTFVGCRYLPKTQTGNPPPTSTSRNGGMPWLVENARTMVPASTSMKEAPLRSGKFRTAVVPWVRWNSPPWAGTAASVGSVNAKAVARIAATARMRCFMLDSPL